MTDMRILIAVDGSNDARLALESLARLPLPEKPVVLALSVVRPLHAIVDSGDTAVRVGAPVEHIVAAADDPGIDLVIVGARGFGPIKRLLLGSVSERVLHHAPCAVLVVKA